MLCVALKFLLTTAGNIFSLVLWVTDVKNLKYIYSSSNDKTKSVKHKYHLQIFMTNRRGCNTVKSTFPATSSNFFYQSTDLNLQIEMIFIELLWTIFEPIIIFKAAKKAKIDLKIKPTHHMQI